MKEDNKYLQYIEPVDIASPNILMAIVWSARRSGDRDLETLARLELSQTYGIKLTFRRDGPLGKVVRK